ncbi:hypothetical protein DCO58_01535 [Helicobacter saguini]|uniref:Uncharacterized protein n=1 Tax=Helicobacter saguini TaxID=1548018 RepID=A0A099BGC7_9HELI|nr:hypothetical protein [Helicobacter saguini]MWV62936.1 hypothetical protein [Helicobacter saguini]MWV66394.1 hypothetical protein [Helicobacter saguini]MWV68746.1 hypothetical protein [Helicobacter saguini]MWV71701.1 hypothetical protein [Helicobacter saguini]TLD91881.1 hypothetical protein LS64_011200 [Helicobacter saguini]
MSNLIHIYNNKIDIFTKDKSVINIESLVKNYDLDSNGDFIESKPIYYLQDSKDSVIANAMKQSTRDSNNKNKENKVSNID